MEIITIISSDESGLLVILMMMIFHTYTGTVYVCVCAKLSFNVIQMYHGDE